MKSTLLILSLAVRCCAMDRMAALSMLESGDCDTCKGKAGEVSRFQMLKSVWCAHTSLPLSAATDALTALPIAIKVADERVANFAAHHGRQPTDFEFYRLWNPKCKAETARRFANLCESKP